MCVDMCSLMIEVSLKTGKKAEFSSLQLEKPTYMQTGGFLWIRRTCIQG